MPIQIKCECGKALRVKDELAGKKVRCPGCSEILVVPTADDEALAPVVAAAAPRKTPPKPKFEDDEDDERTMVTEKPSRKVLTNSKYDEDDDEDDRRPAKSRKRRDDDEEDDDDEDLRYMLKKRGRASPDAPLPTADGGIPSGIGVGLLMMLGAVVWFVGGLAAGITFYYPPILFIIGIAAVVKGTLKK